MFVNDGLGRGYTAKVDSDNRLTVDASVRSAGAIKSLSGDCYVTSTVDTADTLTVNSTGGDMIYISNSSSTKSIVIDKVTVTTDNVKCIYKSIINRVVGTVADYSGGDPVNLNTGSNKRPSATVYVWDEVNNGIGGMTGGTAVTVETLTTGTHVLDDDDTIVLGPQGSFTVSLKNLSTGSMECAVTVRFYEIAL